MFNQASTYFGLETPPEHNGEDLAQKFQFVTWQKNRHKLERDMYLSGCAILSVLCLMLVSYWINKSNELVVTSIERRKKHKTA